MTTTEAPDVEIDYGARWRNPITAQTETIERPPEEDAPLLKVALPKSARKAAVESGL